MKIETDSGHSLPLNRETIHLNSSQRLKRAAQGAGTYFGLAIVSVFIPVFHFILVPLFVILSITVGISRYRKLKYLNLTDTICPVCSNKLKETALYFNEEPIRLFCYECRNQLRIK